MAEIKNTEQTRNKGTRNRHGIRKWILLSTFLPFYLSTFTYSAQKVKFVYDPKGKTVNKVVVAGAFNNWNKSSDILKKKGAEYEIELMLDDGLYYYKFVLDDNQWIEDPLADKELRKPDGYGGFNSAVFVGGETEKKFLAVAPDNINVDALKYEINVIAKDLVEINIRTLSNDVEKVTAVFSAKKIELEKVKTFLGFDYYSAVVLPDAGLFQFELKDGSKKMVYPAQKITLDLKLPKTPPEWAKGAIWYQIMLDRFYDGDAANNPKKTLPWGWDFSKIHPSEKGGFYNFVWNRYFGGDLQGLIRKLDYLKNLGIECIYLTPLFESKSYHGYDTSDYRHINDIYGFPTDYKKLGETGDPKTWKWTETDKLFLEFLKKAHQLGMKVIIDGVFNHSGENFWAFNDLKEKNEKSLYKDWFVITDWDIFKKYSEQGRGYAGWAGFGGLPEFREDENGLVPPVKKHIFDITKRWMDPNNDGNPSEGIDGWRLDVPDCVKINFWKEWVRHVRSINPEAYIVGELWVESPQWIGKDMFDAQMNYPLVRLMTKFFIDKGLNPSEFGKKLKDLLSTYPMQNNLVQMNLLDSHDTDRLASMIFNPHREYDKRNRLNPTDGGDYNKNYLNTKPTKKEYELLKQIAVFQFIFIGSPCIWYGDEVGMWGSDDPFNRKPMLWREIKSDEKGAVVDEQLLAHYKKLTSLRKKYSVLKTGIFKTLLTDDEKSIYAFLREKAGDFAIIVVNNSDRSQTVNLKVPDSILLTDLLNNEKYEVKKNKISLKVKPNWSAILVGSVK